MSKNTASIINIAQKKDIIVSNEKTYDTPAKAIYDQRQQQGWEVLKSDTHGFFYNSLGDKCCWLADDEGNSGAGHCFVLIGVQLGRNDEWNKWKVVSVKQLGPCDGVDVLSAVDDFLNYFHK